MALQEVDENLKEKPKGVRLEELLSIGVDDDVVKEVLRKIKLRRENALRLVRERARNRAIAPGLAPAQTKADFRETDQTKSEKIAPVHRGTNRELQQTRDATMPTESTVPSSLRKKRLMQASRHIQRGNSIYSQKRITSGTKNLAGVVSNQGSSLNELAKREGEQDSEVAFISTMPRNAQYPIWTPDDDGSESQVTQDTDCSEHTRVPKHLQRLFPSHSQMHDKSGDAAQDKFSSKELKLSSVTEILQGTLCSACVAPYDLIKSDSLNQTEVPEEIDVKGHVVKSFLDSHPVLVSQRSENEKAIRDAGEMSPRPNQGAIEMASPRQRQISDVEEYNGRIQDSAQGVSFVTISSPNRSSEPSTPVRDLEADAKTRSSSIIPKARIAFSVEGVAKTSIAHVDRYAEHDASNSHRKDPSVPHSSRMFDMEKSYATLTDFDGMCCHAMIEDPELGSYPMPAGRILENDKIDATSAGLEDLFDHGTRLHRNAFERFDKNYGTHAEVDKNNNVPVPVSSSLDKAKVPSKDDLHQIDSTPLALTGDKGTHQTSSTNSAKLRPLIDKEDEKFDTVGLPLTKKEIQKPLQCAVTKSTCDLLAIPTLASSSKKDKVGCNQIHRHQKSYSPPLADEPVGEYEKGNERDNPAQLENVSHRMKSISFGTSFPQRGISKAWSYGSPQYSPTGVRSIGFWSEASNNSIESCIGIDQSHINLVQTDFDLVEIVCMPEAVETCSSIEGLSKHDAAVVLSPSESVSYVDSTFVSPSHINSQLDEFSQQPYPGLPATKPHENVPTAGIATLTPSSKRWWSFPSSSLELSKPGPSSLEIRKTITEKELPLLESKNTVEYDNVDIPSRTSTASFIEYILQNVHDDSIWPIQEVHDDSILPNQDVHDDSIVPNQVDDFNAPQVNVVTNFATAPQRLQRVQLNTTLESKTRIAARRSLVKPSFRPWWFLPSFGSPDRRRNLFSRSYAPHADKYSPSVDDDDELSSDSDDQSFFGDDASIDELHSLDEEHSFDEEGPSLHEDESFDKDWTESVSEGVDKVVQALDATASGLFPKATEIGDMWLAKAVLNRLATSRNVTVDDLIEDACDKLDDFEMAMFSSAFQNADPDFDADADVDTESDIDSDTDSHAQKSQK